MFDRSFRKLLPRPKPSPAAEGQESVWRYPRPPLLEPERRPVRIEFAGRVLAQTNAAMRVLETSHPPVYFLPRDSFDPDMLELRSGGSYCEWKGEAAYLDIVSPDGRRAEGAAFCYPEPTPRFESIAGYLSVYAGPMDACWVGDDRVQPQPGGFYSGWITPWVVGPFKGIPGSQGW